MISAKSSLQTVVRQDKTSTCTHYSSIASRHTAVRYCCSQSAAVSKMIYSKHKCNQRAIVPSLNWHSQQTNISITTNNKVSGKSRLNTICRLKPLVIYSVKLRNGFKGKYFRHLTRVLVRFPETKCMSKFIVPHFSRGENAVHSSVERM